MNKTRTSKIEKEKIKKKNSNDRSPATWKYGNIIDCKKAYINHITHDLKI